MACACGVSAADAAKVAAWREAMARLAALPQVYCKLSMLGSVVRGWPADASKEAVLRGLVLEVVELFGARRCMCAAPVPHTPRRQATPARPCACPPRHPAAHPLGRASAASPPLVLSCAAFLRVCA